MTKQEQRDLVSSVADAAVGWLREVQNPDSGLPSDREGSRSCTWTTSGLLWAAWCAGSQLTESHLRRALAWVSSHLNDDGGVPIVAYGDYSITDATAQTALACSLLLAETNCGRTAETFRSCLRWLLDKRLTHEGWNWRPSAEPSRTASTCFALVALRAGHRFFPDLVDEITTAQNEALAWLRSSQHRSGAWGSYAGDILQPAITGFEYREQR